MNLKVNKTVKILAGLSVVLSSSLSSLNVLAATTESPTIQPNYEKELEKLEGMAKTSQEKQILESIKKISEKKLEQNTKQAYAKGYDKSITSISTIAKPENKKTEFTLRFDKKPNAKNAYEGEASGKINIPISGRLNGSNWLIPNGPEFIEDYENGNIGLRVNFTLPEGTDAKSIVRTIDWEKSNADTEGYYNIKWLGIPLPIKCKVGTVWDRKTIQYGKKANEFSMALRSIRKSEVSTQEWEKYDPGSTYFALTAAGLLHSGTGEGEMWGKLHLDFSKYEGNTDDLSTNKEITSGKLAPAKDGTFKIKAHFIDRSALIAGAEGKKNLSQAIIKPGMEYINPYDSKAIESWDSYISLWDRNEKYNIASNNEPEIPGINSTLPGASIFERDIVVNKEEDFNTFEKNRFVRVINYLDKTDVTNGSIGNIDRVEVSSLPTRVPDNVETPVKYTGKVSYSNGETRELLPGTLNVTNKSQPNIETKLTANDYTIGEQYITGSHSEDIAKIKVFVNGVDRMTTAGNNNGKGQYKIYAYDYIKNVSDNVVVKGLDASGNVIKETPVNVKKGQDVETYLTANNYKIAPNSQYVTGTHSTDVDKIKLFVNGSDRMTTAANNGGAQGTYRIYAYDFIKSTSDNVVVKALNKSGQVIKETKVNITQDTGSITASNFKISTDELINGTFTGNIAVVKLYVDGVARNQVRPTGSNYSLYAAGYVTSASQNVVVTGFDANGIQVASQKVNVSN
ncbi:hypothetical protein BMT55_03710 [Listeria newyorkensis]|uniref:Bacterial Ig domain-containing protein n=1 Tax=Listeria newyorkensis TaxID=1497681 RepID=A0ABX4XPB7_9LIST|nr:immunoglobulin-like domain-containing protein [Listeria newyorkensis]KGL42002.1 hypothetical protein EP58_10715 [Listeria newyorkensis]PNP93885.1 hypothetical protein BMT55_03710 [Listeria newyorkensis]WAO22509.1 hypothetical protein OTR81_04340 [Listeria newyorkensis]SQC51068.1 Uncharacterised protein [Listeria newyorkensis]